MSEALEDYMELSILFMRFDKIGGFAKTKKSLLSILFMRFGTLFLRTFFLDLLLSILFMRFFSNKDFQKERY